MDGKCNICGYKGSIHRHYQTRRRLEADLISSVSNRLEFTRVGVVKTNKKEHSWRVVRCKKETITLYYLVSQFNFLPSDCDTLSVCPCVCGILKLIIVVVDVRSMSVRRGVTGANGGVFIIVMLPSRIVGACVVHPVLQVSLQPLEMRKHCRHV